eukprot:361262-Chlamydomonas_euryale.AAC.6
MAEATTKVKGFAEAWAERKDRLNATVNDSAFGRFFQMAARNTNLTQELRAGIVCFLTVAYIILGAWDASRGLPARSRRRRHHPHPLALSVPLPGHGGPAPFMLDDMTTRHLPLLCPLAPRSRQLRHPGRHRRLLRPSRQLQRERDAMEETGRGERKGEGGGMARSYHQNASAVGGV